MPDVRLPLLVTKMHIPPIQSGWVRRERLLQRLGALNEKKCALVTGPAGYGKSVLLAQWIDEAQRQSTAAAGLARYGWLSLDEGDNDPVRFWSYLVGALPVAGIGGEFFELLHAPLYGGMENLLILLINELAGIPGSLFLVLDDIHTLTQPALLEGLRFFLDHLPPNLHLVFAGRSEPALSLARLRARGQIIELLAPELRFTRPETGQFFQKSLRLALSEAEIDLLDKRTEGWAASLQLVAHSLAASPDQHGSIQSFSGSEANILDYLVEEIFDRQSPEMQDFLQRTSILERLCASLCSGLLPEASRPRAAALLEEIERANLFLIPLNSGSSSTGSSKWYRYHPLFAELLQARLHAAVPDQAPELHRRAARWLAQNQLPFEAFRQAQAAGDLVIAEELVRAALPTLVEQGETTNLQTWLDAFPRIFVLEHAALCLGYAWVSLYRLDFAQAEDWAQRAERLVETSAAGPEDAAAREFLGQSTAIRATAAINFKNYPAAIQLARQSLEYLNPADQRWDSLRSLIFLNLGDAYSVSGDQEAAIQALLEALQMPHPPANPFIKAVVIGSLGNQYLRMGRLREAEAALQPVFTLEDENRPLLAAGKSMVYLARIYVEQNQLDRAAEMGRRALETCQRWNHPDHLFDALLTWAEVCSLRGDSAGCQSALEQARDHLRRLKIALRVENPHIFAIAYERSLRLFEARLALRAQEGPAAGQKTGQRVLSRLYPTGEIPAIERLGQDFNLAAVTGLAWLQEGRSRDVFALAEKIHLPGWLRREIQAFYFEALASDLLGDSRAANLSLTQALELAQPEGYIRLFLDGGAAARRIFQTYQRSPHLMPGLSAYVAQVLDAFDSPSSDSPMPEPGYGQISAREIEVLRLLAAGLSNDEIAARLVLSTNTVKTHLKRIFEKLGAGSRIEAVNLARTQGLIS